MLFNLIYYSSYIILIPGIIFALFCQLYVTKQFNKYKKTNVSSGYNAGETAECILKNNGVYGVSINRISGKLTDNYNPTNKTLNLSSEVYNSSSISAIGVCAHECGHAIQDEENYFLLNLRKFLVPVTNFGSMLALPIAILGVIIEWFATSQTNFGTYLLGFGIFLYSLSTIFALITLPVEINASRRAIQNLQNYGIVNKNEVKGVKKVLTSAGLTYFASLVVSLLYLLRFILIISSFRRKD